MKLNRTLLALAAASVLATGATGAFAGEDEIKYRQSVFKSVGGHMTAMVTILKTDAGNEADLIHHARGMAALAKIAQGSAFPKNSSLMDGKTQAKDEIWDKPDDFKKVTDNFIKYSAALVTAAESGDKGAIGKAVGALGKNACKACHDNFRDKNQ